MDTKLAKTIGEGVRAARKSRGMSQLDAAEAAGISLEFLGRIERGGTLPSTPTLRSLAASLGASADVLLGLAVPGARALGGVRQERKTESSPELRRLERRLRRARPKTLRLLNLVAAALEGRSNGEE